jgi:hypothetical protein
MNPAKFIEYMIAANEEAIKTSQDNIAESKTKLARLARDISADEAIIVKLSKEIEEYQIAHKAIMKKRKSDLKTACEDIIKKTQK